MSEEFKNDLEKLYYIRHLEYVERVTKNITERCDLELKRIKNNRPVSCLSRYRKNHTTDTHPSACGFKRYVVPVGEISMWNDAFEYFKNQKVNKKTGKKVDRSKVFDGRNGGYKNFIYGQS